MRISDWSSDVCSSDLQQGDDALPVGRALVDVVALVGGADRIDVRAGVRREVGQAVQAAQVAEMRHQVFRDGTRVEGVAALLGDPLQGRGEQRLALHAAEGRRHAARQVRSEEHTSELQSLMRTSYAVFCLKKKKRKRKR